MSIHVVVCRASAVDGMEAGCEIKMGIRGGGKRVGDASHGAKQFVFGVACPGWLWLSVGDAIADRLRDQWFKFGLLHEQQQLQRHAFGGQRWIHVCLE